MHCRLSQHLPKRFFIVSVQSLPIKNVAAEGKKKLGRTEDNRSENHDARVRRQKAEKVNREKLHRYTIQINKILRDAIRHNKNLLYRVRYIKPLLHQRRRQFQSTNVINFN